MNINDAKIVDTSIAQENRYVVRGFREDHLGREVQFEDYRLTRVFERKDAAEAYRDFVRGETYLQAYEIESHGTSWEVSTGDNRFVASVDTREQAAEWGATEFHDLAEWYASQEFLETQES